MVVNGPLAMHLTLSLVCAHVSVSTCTFVLQFRLKIAQSPMRKGNPIPLIQGE